MSSSILKRPLTKSTIGGCSPSWNSKRSEEIYHGGLKTSSRDGQWPKEWLQTIRVAVYDKVHYDLTLLIKTIHEQDRSVLNIIEKLLNCFKASILNPNNYTIAHDILWRTTRLSHGRTFIGHLCKLSPSFSSSLPLLGWPPQKWDL